MAGISALQFEQPQIIARASAKMHDDQGNEFRITVTGPEESFKNYVENAPIRLRLVSLDQRPNYEQPQSARTLTEQVEKDPPRDDPTRDLDIRIEIVSQPPDRHLMVVELDPFLPAGANHNYYVDGVNWATATCNTSSGDMDIFLYEEGTSPSGCFWIEPPVQSTNPSTTPDTVSAVQHATGRWRLRVNGWATGSYSLTGVFGNI